MRADVFGVGFPVRVAVLSVAVLLAATGVDRVYAASPVANVTAKMAHDLAGPGDPGGNRPCVLAAAGRWHSSASEAESSDHRAPSHHDHPRGSGNVTADIPPTVFIRRIGPWLFVTTNTGRAPSAGDTYYYIANGHAAIAVSQLQHRVERQCGRHR